MENKETETTAGIDLEDAQADTDQADTGQEDNGLTGHQSADLAAQLQELENRLLRAHADFDNFRRRTRMEKEDLAKYASAKLVTQLLPVMDNFILALSSETTDAEGLKKGIEMVFRQLQNVLEQEGLVPMEAVGKPFDPNFHEAVMQVEQEGTAPGIVVDEMRKGYLLKDKVIRPAMVKVSI